MAKSGGTADGTGSAGGLGSNIAGALKNFGSNVATRYNSNPDLYNKIGGALGSGIAGIVGGPQNRQLRANQIKASYYKNPLLNASLGQPTDYSDYYADFLNNMYLNNIAKEAEKARQRGLIEADTDNWYNQYIANQQTQAPQITSGGSGVLGLDAMEGTIA